MIDIVSNETGLDMGVVDTQTSRAANLLSTQIQSLEYADDFGIDLKYFLSDEFRFQNESFRAYLIERLANWGINVSDVIDVAESLHRQYTFELTPAETSSGLIAR